MENWSQVVKNIFLYSYGKLYKSKLYIKSNLLFKLRFAGNKITVRQVAQLFNVSESTCWTICNRVIEYLMDISVEVIKFPKTLCDLDNLADQFEQVRNILSTYIDSVIILNIVNNLYLPSVPTF